MDKIKKYKYYILSFIIPLTICIIFLSIKGVFKNVELFMVSDMRGQHLAFYNYLKNVLLGKNSIYYSYFAGMGRSMISTLVFYTTSPINILLILIKDIEFAILFIYIIKICLSGLTMFIYLKNKFKKNKFITIVFSTCYAITAYVINFSFCIFWFDIIYLAPLVLLGIDKIFAKEKINLLYIFSLALAIICNIQMGFGLCIFSVIYYLYSFNIENNIKKDFKKFLKLSSIFAISSLCAGAISSGFILALLTDYNSISSIRKSGVGLFNSTSNIDYIIKNTFSIGMKKSNYYNEYEPYIYCGLIIPILSVLYFFNNKIPKGKKKHTLIVILIFTFSFCIYSLNTFWHLSEPIFLNYRYSIYLSLFLITIAYESYLKKEHLTRKDIIIVLITLTLGLIIDLIYINKICIKETIIFLTLTTILIFLTKNLSKRFEIILCITILIELSFNAYLSFYSNADISGSIYSSLDSLYKLASYDKLDPSYRVIYDYSYTSKCSDAFILNKNSSLRYFSSIFNPDISKLYDRLFIFSSQNGYNVSAYTPPLIMSILGNKYFYLLDDIDFGIYKKNNTYTIKNNNYINKKTKRKKVYFYENPYSLSLGFVIENDIKYKKEYDVIDYQNEIIKSFTGKDIKVEQKLEYEIEEDKTNKDNDFKKLHVYVYNNTNNNNINLYTESVLMHLDSDIPYYGNDKAPILIKSPKKKIKVTIKKDPGYNLKRLRFSTYNKDNLIKNLKILQENMLTNVKINKNIMKAKLNSSKDGILFLSIPYDKNFKIYVDGKKTKYYPVLDNTFIGLDIKKGSHNIKLINTDDNLKWYVLSSVLSIIITLILYKYLNKKYDE